MVYTKSRFEWDAAKSHANFVKHGISFETAVTAFDDPNAQLVVDFAHSSAKELREWLIGRTCSEALGEDRLVVVVHTIRDFEPGGAVVRIISCRYANRTERVFYEKKVR
jgi:uncharacterized DUF497 family protein